MKTLKEIPVNTQFKIGVYSLNHTFRKEETRYSDQFGSQFNVVTDLKRNTLKIMEENTVVYEIQ